jgi:hypothetical protein
MGDPRAHPRVGREERLHPVRVPRENDDQVVAVVLHVLQQDLDRLASVVPLVLRPVQVVGLVDEQHAAQGAPQDLLGLRRGVPDVLADQVVPGDRHQVPAAQVTQAVQQLAHPLRHRRLAGARVPGEAHVQGGPLRPQAEPGPHPVHDQERRDLPDPGLDRGKAHELVIEGGKDFLGRGQGAFGGQVDQRVVGQRPGTGGTRDRLGFRGFRGFCLRFGPDRARARHLEPVVPGGTGAGHVG